MLTETALDAIVVDWLLSIPRARELLMPLVVEWNDALGDALAQFDDRLQQSDLVAGHRHYALETCPACQENALVRRFNHERDEINDDGDPIRHGQVAWTLDCPHCGHADGQAPG